MQSKIIAYAGYSDNTRAQVMFTINNVRVDSLQAHNKETIKENCRQIAEELGRDFSHCELVTVEIL